MVKKFTKISLVLGIILSLIIFFNSNSLISYGLSAIIFTLAMGSIGLIIDKLAIKQYKLPIILIILYALISGFYLFINSNTLNCLGCGHEVYKNIFTGQCKEFCVGCGSYAPWYWSVSESCVESVFRDKCNKLTPNQLKDYNNSCDIYIEINKQLWGYMGN